MKTSISLNRFSVLVVVAILSLGQMANSQDAAESEYYTITRFETPLDETIEACGFQLMDDGRMAVCSRRGDIFMIERPFDEQVSANQFKVFARGLHEPLSLSTRDGWLYATQRPE